MTNAMINAIFTGGVNHGVICIPRFIATEYSLAITSFGNCCSLKLSET